MLSAALLGVQFWLFTWAPVHGRALEVSLGYFLLPLAMVLVGRVVYGERLSRFQQLATIAALLGVANELFVLGHFAWPTMVVALGYPVYFVLRRTLGTDHFGGLWWDMLLMVPVAVWFLAASDRPLGLLVDDPKLFALLPLMGVMSAAAVAAYMLASRLLPFGLFGLLSYVEPVLLVIVALLLGEGLEHGQLLTYVPIWIAVALLAVEGGLRIGRSRAGAGRVPVAADGAVVVGGAVGVAHGGGAVATDGAATGPEAEPDARGASTVI